jgi:hypothetical protein
MGETPSQYRGRDHGDMDEFPACVTKVLTRPRRATT